MMVDASMSLLKERESSTRDAIVNVLSEKWPLTAKDLYSALVKEKFISISYQAVHKTLAQLEAEGIVERIGRDYRLNKHWINHVKQFGSHLDEAYSNARNGFDIQPNFAGVLKFKFTNVSYLATSLAELFRKKILCGKEDPALYVFFEHGWWPLEFAFPDFILLKNMVSSCGLASGIIKHDTPFDRLIVQYYGLAGSKNVLVGVDHGMENCYFIQGDAIVEIQSSSETKKTMDKIYNSVTSLTDLLVFYTHNKDLRVEFDVKIYKNKDLANALKEKLVHLVGKHANGNRFPTLALI